MAHADESNSDEVTPIPNVGVFIRIGEEDDDIYRYAWGLEHWQDPDLPDPWELAQIVRYIDESEDKK